MGLYNIFTFIFIDQSLFFSIAHHGDRSTDMKMRQVRSRLQCLVLPCPVLPCVSVVCSGVNLSSSCLVSCAVLCCLVLSCLGLSCLVLSCLVVSCPIVSCLVVSCLVVSCVVLSCLVLSCLALSSLVFCVPLRVALCSLFLSSFVSREPKRHRFHFQVLFPSLSSSL
jgi:hypothetical protein